MVKATFAYQNIGLQIRKQIWHLPSLPHIYSSVLSQFCDLSADRNFVQIHFSSSGGSCICRRDMFLMKDCSQAKSQRISVVWATDKKKIVDWFLMSNNSSQLHCKFQATMVNFVFWCLRDAFVCSVQIFIQICIIFSTSLFKWTVKKQTADKCFQG